MVIATGGCFEAKIIKAYGGEIKIVERLKIYSTTYFVDRIKSI
jgi:bifunctional ADP-heptose synthase (sugar kinase/adenylyltransferase)